MPQKHESNHFGDTALIDGILKRLAEGDARARNELLERVQGRLRFLAEMVCKSFPKATVDEAVSGANYRLVRALSEVRPSSVPDFMRWAAKHIRWELTDLARSRGVSLSGDVEDSTVVSVTLSECTDFHEAVDSLPPDHKEVFDLWYYAGMKGPEIARILGLSERTVYGRLNRAKLTLSSALNPQHGSDHIEPSQRC